MNHRFVQKAALALSLATTGTLMAGCRGDLSASTGSSSGVNTSVITGSGGTTTSGTAVNDAFWVKPYFDPTNPDAVYSFYLHEQQSLYSSAKCQIAPGSPAYDIYCYLDVNELDLWMNGLSLVFNAPVGMCSYTSIYLYSFYILPAGQYAPPPITIAKDATGAVTGVTFTAGGAVPGTGHNAVPINPLGTAPTCPFDYSEVGGPNCCEGNYTVTINQAGAGTNPGTSFTLNGNFGGKMSNCIVGPGKDVFPTSSGYPAEVIQRTTLAGQNRQVNLVAPFNKQNSDGSRYQGNIYIANYFNPTTFGFGGSTWPVPSSNWPRAISGDVISSPSFTLKTKPYSFTNGTDYMSRPPVLSPYYQYECLDKDAEVLARIRLLVSSWDTLANWGAYPGTGPYSGVTPENSFPEYYKHDFSVWEDYFNFFPGLAL